MGIRNLPAWLTGSLKPTKLELPLHLGSHTHNLVPPPNVLITWNFDDLNDSHADDMVQAYRYRPNQSSERGTDREAGRRDVKETFSQSRDGSSSSFSCIFMPAPPVSGFPKFIRSRRTVRRPFLIYAASHATAPSPPTASQIPLFLSFIYGHILGESWWEKNYFCSPLSTPFN